MKSASAKRYDGGRERCIECGHPRKEHNDTIGCSVPKCACPHYTQLSKPELVEKGTIAS